MQTPQSDSLYAEYVRERTNDKIIEYSYGFIVYRYLDDNRVYIIDIYIDPKLRRQYFGSDLGHKVCKEAKDKGCTEVIGTVLTTAKHPDHSVKALLGFGMQIYGAENNIIYFKKRL